VIYGFEHLGEIEEPDWPRFVELFDESGFDVYITRALVEVDERTKSSHLHVTSKRST
jgi:hypothetical protein